MRETEVQIPHEIFAHRRSDRRRRCADSHKPHARIRGSGRARRVRQAAGGRKGRLFHSRSGCRWRGHACCRGVGNREGAGLLRRRGWARISMLILAALLACASLPSLAAEPRMIRAVTGIPTVGAFPAFIAAQFGPLQLAVAVWWIVYFTRKSVRAQFGFAATPSAAPPKP